MADTGGSKGGIKIVADNRRARRNYEILDTFEAGIVLRGSEIKSIRDGKVQLKDSYADVRGTEVWLVGTHIAEYQNAGYAQHAPERERKLLLHAREIERLGRGIQEKGLTVIPLKVYLKGGRAKVEIALARGRKEYDKREAVKKKEAAREIDRVIKKASR